MRITFAIAALACGAIAYACGNFDEADDVPSEDAGTDVASSDAANEASADGAIDDAGDAGTDGDKDGSTTLGVHAPTCPPSPGPSCKPITNCVKLELYAPPDAGAEYPFGIVTDSKYVYWTAMAFGTAGDAPYDGRGTATIRRVDRSGNGKAGVLVTGQRNATALAIAGEYLYWGSTESGMTTLRRVHRGCPESCAVENLGPIGTTPLWKITELDDTTLVAVAGSGDVYHVAIGQNLAAITQYGSVGLLPALVGTPSAAYAASGVQAQVQRVSHDGGSMTIGTVPEAGADSGLTIGISPMATDCTTLYGWRNNKQVWSLPRDGGAVKSFATVQTSGIFSMASDDTFVYLGSADGPGVMALDIASKQSAQIAGGNLQYVAVDDVGVYWGEHGQTTGGALWMMKKQ